jgi:hypothetical protein
VGVAKFHGREGFTAHSDLIEDVGDDVIVHPSATEKNVLEREAHKQNSNTKELLSIKGDTPINKYTPAVTIVAACIKAETGEDS